MRFQKRSFHMMLLGVAMMVLGWLFPFLMVARVVSASFTLNLVSYALSIAGLMVGLIGLFQYAQGRR